MAHVASVACDLCGKLSPNLKVGKPEFPETDKRYGPLLCPACFTTWESDATEKEQIEAGEPITWVDMLDADYADFTPNNPDDGRMCHTSEWEYSRGYFMQDYD